MNISIPSPEGSGLPDIDYYDSIHLAESLGTYAFPSSPTQCEYSAAPITPSTDWPLTPQTPSFKTFDTPGHDNHSQYMSSGYDHFVTAPAADFKVLESPTAAFDSNSGIITPPTCGSIPPSPMIEQGMFDYNYSICYNMDSLHSYSNVVAQATASGLSRGLDCVAKPPMAMEEWIEPTFAAPAPTHATISQKRSRTSPFFPYRRLSNPSNQSPAKPCVFETDDNMAFTRSAPSLPSSPSLPHLPLAISTSRLVLKPFVASRQRAANGPITLSRPGTHMAGEVLDDRRLQWTDTFEGSSRGPKTRAPRRRKVKPTSTAPALQSSCAAVPFPSVLLPVPPPERIEKPMTLHTEYVPLSPPESPVLPNASIIGRTPPIPSMTFQDETASVVGAARARKHRPAQIQIPAQPATKICVLSPNKTVSP
ncbi:BZ3500_MvSof-1268-A1-R1_Chr10-2g02937 [Microbotryum saponariae]|uniref:BZ3500_MvSof-1268-A1-R1_Chr10-2g02937 protein n=1 Tax=Microbotryum saponariae TaxID=289078 RepID=A0A2X0LAT4_9BASI|nr:BZ3501_MvSof-1269-A2-R1_Chr10-2g02523 [Microbotryum saponariae]SDA01778.1 BZ3500_MvSof-1268-A1-R1_Chr10-2g02937 [Microbotryum saponariae]